MELTTMLTLDTMVRP